MREFFFGNKKEVEKPMLGSVSGKYESKNCAGAVSCGLGDLGGVSYGAHQFIASVANDFASWLLKKGHSYGAKLMRYNAPTENFSNVWKQIAKDDNDGFLNLQHEYTKIQYYEPAKKHLKEANFFLDNHSNAMKECVFSRAVQYGASNIVEIFDEGLKKLNITYLNLSYVDDIHFDESMLIAIYGFLIEECDNAYQLNTGLWHSPKDWVNGSYDVVKIGLRNRFINERNDLLAMLEKEVRI